MTQVTMEVNGRRVAEEAPARMHLGDFLRDRLRLTGTHLGCEHGVCGACTVLVDGQPVRSCISYAVACDGRRVTTIEGYDADPVMRRLREAFTRHHALQCGYCTPGMLATARDIVLRLPDADEARVRVELSGNLCRCTGYMGIVAAVMSVLGALREAADTEVEQLRAAVRRGDGGTPAKAPAAFEVFTATAATAGPAAATAAAAAIAAKDARPPGVEARSAARPAALAGDATASTGAPAGAAAGKTNRIDGTFDVPFTAGQVWAFMADLPAVAACLPGAAIEEQQGDRVKGTISVKFGPMRAAFNGAARLDRDDAAMRAVFRGAGQDTVSRSRANGDIVYRVEDAGNGGARVRVEMAYSLQGPLAQFSRSGLVQDFVRRMIADFGRNVAARMAGTADAQPAPASFNASGMFFQVLWARIRRWFGRGG
ncbi:xanthine dehydrogenase family Fe-S subunit [Bordetella bronchialis]|uniref:Carbon monoxide dehydrogenase n=1 Tax=Bordetella bronchialis TaxID=463025 RepID=A0ABN4R118_9BORD|nr:2Fe-2S iron-sulfur cluster-binding protein [Bordetella bronchialis]ANN66975.1 carbon monoxide dehydrogenase [Bordetella bronchialis]